MDAASCHTSASRLALGLTAILPLDKPAQKMITIGLVGGVASGKSLVAQDFQKLGAFLIDGDRIGHEVLGLEHVNVKLVERWGRSILDEDGKLHRGEIARIVFGKSKKAKSELKFLESLTHPEIRSRIAGRITQVTNSGRHSGVVIDAAVMFKAGWNDLCDYVVFVDAPKELRLRRAVVRGLTEDQFTAREAAQLSVEEKKHLSDIIVDNSGPPQKTFQEVEKVWHSLFEIA